VRLGGRHNMPPPLLTVGQRVCKFKGVSKEILRANLWSGGKNCPRPMCVPNLKIVAFSVCVILRGSQNFEIGSRPQATPNFGPICGPGARTARGLCAYKFEGRSFIRLRNIGTFRCAALIDPVTLTFDHLTLRLVWESHVT